MPDATNPETPALDRVVLLAGDGSMAELSSLKRSLAELRESMAEAAEILATVEPPIRDKRAVAALAALDATNNASVTHEGYFIVGWCARNEEVAELREENGRLRVEQARAVEAIEAADANLRSCMDLRRMEAGEFKKEIAELRERSSALEAALRIHIQALEVARDWNLDEIEIDGKMRNTYELVDAARSLLARKGVGK